MSGWRVRGQAGLGVRRLRGSRDDRMGQSGGQREVRLLGSCGGFSYGSLRGGKFGS